MLRAIRNSSFEAMTPTIPERGILAVRADFILQSL